MANKAEIRLQIVTALDAAGIKATQQQIDQMANSIAASNKKMGASANEAAARLGRMRGPIGKLTSAFGNLGGTMGKTVGIVGMIAGAFSTGVAAGTKLWQAIQYIRKEWFHYVSELDKVKKANRALAKQREADTAAWTRQMETMKAARAEEEAASKAALASINAEAEAWRTAARAKVAYLSAGMDAEDQRLEREKFEDVLALQANGYGETEIQQVEAIYDVLKAELDVRREMERIEAKEAEENAKVLEQRNKLAEASQRESEAAYWQMKVREQIKKLEEWDFEGAERTTDKERDRRLRFARRELVAANRARQQAGDEYDAIRAKMADVDTLEATQALRRATAMDVANLARDRAAMAYDKATANGDALGLQFSEGYIQYVRQSTEQSYRALLEIQRNTADYDAVLTKLLTMKGGE